MRGGSRTSQAALLTVFGRKHLLVIGWIAAGTAFVYPTLLAVIADVAHASWRASAVGVYRFWRDLGYAAGALLSGIVADLFG